MIVVNKGGFRVIPKGGDMGDRELGEEEGMITGSIIAVGGGNGTIAAATMKK